jgi:hypothetical protein
MERRRLRQWIATAAALGSAAFAAQPARAQSAPPLWPYPNGSPTIVPCVPGFVNPLPPGSTCTVSTNHHETDIRVDLPDATAFATRVLGTAIVTGPGIDVHATAFDQSVSAAPGSAQVLALFDQAGAAARARALAIAAGRPFVAIMQSAPTLIASASTRGASVLVGHEPITVGGPNVTVFAPGAGSTAYAFPRADNESLTITNTITLGPGTVLFGPDLANSAFVPAGTLNIDTNIAYESFFTDSYQATVTNTATYEITVSLILQLIGTIHPALQSASYDLGGRFLRGLGEEGDLGRCGANAVHCAWAEGYGLSSRDKAQAMVPGNSARTGAFAGGLAFRVAPGLNLGFGIGEGWSAIDQEVGSEHADLSFTQFGLDAAYRAGGWRLTAALLGATGHAGTHHGDASLGGTSTARYGLSMWGARSEIGYRIGAGSWSLTPKLGGDWARVHSDAFVEVGGPALTAPAHDANRTRGFVGLAAEDRLALDGQPLTLTAEARLTDVLSGRARVLPVAFAGQALAVEGLSEGRFAGDLDVTAAFHFTRNATFALTGEGEVAQRGGRAWGGRAALSVGF